MNKITQLQPESRRRGALSVKELALDLVLLNYRYYKPASSTWMMSFILKKEKMTLCVLFRKNGIDLRYYENINSEIALTETGMVHFRGGKIYRNHYNESQCVVTNKINKIAKAFAEGRVLSRLNIEDGRSYRRNPKFTETQRKSRERFEIRFKDRAGKKLPGAFP